MYENESELQSDLRASKKVREELLARIDSIQEKLLALCKLMDLLREYDPEGFDDMRRSMFA